MRRASAAVASLAAILASTASSADQVERVPDTIHSPGTDRPQLCGLTAASVVDLEMRTKARPDAEVLDRTTEYNAYAIGGLRQLTFTTATNKAHPAAVCRQVEAAPGGGSTIRTSIACYNSRENCDWLYREFEALTKRTIDDMTVAQ